MSRLSRDRSRAITALGQRASVTAENFGVRYESSPADWPRSPEANAEMAFTPLGG
jgi:hypothetical protein